MFSHPLYFSITLLKQKGGGSGIKNGISQDDTQEGQMEMEDDETREDGREGREKDMEEEQHLVEDKEKDLFGAGKGRRSTVQSIIKERAGKKGTEYRLQIRKYGKRPFFEWWEEEKLEGTQLLEEYCEAQQSEEYPQPQWFPLQNQIRYQEGRRRPTTRRASCTLSDGDI